MPTSHPYISGAGNVTAIIAQLRRNFPQTVTSETVRKFGIASNNESYLVNMLAFLGLIDEKGKRTEKGHDVLATHKEEDFRKGFGELVKKAYSDLFGTFGDPAGWQQDRDALVNYFRKTDKTSDIIGRRQAGTFLALAGLAGHAEPTQEAAKSKPAAAPKTAAAAKTAKKKVELAPPANTNIKREINLPAGGTQETYDAIFKSIKANLIDE